MSWYWVRFNGIQSDTNQNDSLHTVTLTLPKTSPIEGTTEKSRKDFQKLWKELTKGKKKK